MSDELHTDTDNFYVFLDSRNTTTYLNSSYNSHVKFDFDQTIIFDKRAIKIACSVLSFSCPNSIYNINETNSFISISINGGSYIGYTLTYGNYNVNTFISQLLLLIGSSFSISINSLTNKLTISHSTYDFSIGSASTLYSVMGFSQNTLYSSSSKSLSLPYTVNFNGLQNMNIYMNNIGTRNIDSYSKYTSSLIQIIQINPNDTLIQFINNSAEEKFTIYQNSIDYIEISIKDTLGNYINLNNQNWNMTLVFSILRDLDRFSYKNTFFNTLISGYN
jgi:hypothetical protein